MALALRELNPGQGVSERHLVSAVRRGDDRAFELLFERYRRRIASYIYGLVRDAGRAEDITQEVFIAALRRLRETERPIAFKPWIYEIAKNACIDEFRRSSRAIVVSLDEEADRARPVAPLVDHISPDIAWERRERFDHFIAAFTGLSDLHHRMLVMRELEGLSYAEIGGRLDMSRTVVESTLFRARRRLSAEYEELASGRQCERVQSAIDGLVVRTARSPGIRERRRISRHLRHCHACVRHAREAGVEESLLRAPSVAERIAAVLPIGPLPAILRRFAARHGAAAASGTALADGSATLAISRAVAAVAALAVAGVALPSVSSATRHGAHSTTVPASISRAPVPTWIALPLNVGATRSTEPERMPPVELFGNAQTYRVALHHQTQSAAAHRGGATSRASQTTHGQQGARGPGSVRAGSGSTPAPSGTQAARSAAGDSSQAGRRVLRGRRPLTGHGRAVLKSRPRVGSGSSRLATAGKGLVSRGTHTVAAVGGAVSQVGAAAGRTVSQTGDAVEGAVTQTGSAVGNAVSQTAGSVGGPVSQAGQAVGAAVSGTSATAGAAVGNSGAVVGAVAAQTGQVAGAATSALTQH